MLKRFVSQFSSGSIKGILGDREFIGEQRWGWLNRQQILFVIRMKANLLYRDQQDRECCVGPLFKPLAPGESSVLRKVRHVSGLPVWLSAMRLKRGELLILASDREQPKPFEVYSLRWKIEHWFQCLKGWGLNMEDTRSTHYY